MPSRALPAEGIPEPHIIDLDACILTFEDGVQVPITNAFDVFAEELVQPWSRADIASIVAGPLPSGKWFTCRIFPGDFVRRGLH